MSGQRGASIRPQGERVVVLHGKAAMVNDQTCTPRFAFAEPYKTQPNRLGFVVSGSQDFGVSITVTQ